MSSVKRISGLIRKDILLETRQQYSFYGILLYIATTIFVVYLTMGNPEASVWNGLFWIIQLFVCVNAVAKSFLQENKSRMLYFYTIAGAKDFVLSKLIFNALLMLAMSLLSLFVFIMLLGNPVINMWEFIGITCLGGVGLSLVFTFLAAIAAKAQQQAALITIMGFPVILPQLLLLSRIANIAFTNEKTEGLFRLVLLLGGLDILVILLAVILFPFLWKD